MSLNEKIIASYKNVTLNYGFFFKTCLRLLQLKLHCYNTQWANILKFLTYSLTIFIITGLHIISWVKKVDLYLFRQLKRRVLKSIAIKWERERISLGSIYMHHFDLFLFIVTKKTVQSSWSRAIDLSTKLNSL